MAKFDPMIGVRVAVAIFAAAAFAAMATSATAAMHARRMYG